MRTNKIYQVRIAQYTYVNVEADNARDAQELAGRHMHHINDFVRWEDWPVVNACDGAPTVVDEGMDWIFTHDGILMRRQYERELKAQANEPLMYIPLADALKKTRQSYPLIYTTSYVVTRTLNGLRGLNVTTLGGLCKIHKTDVLKARRMGKHCLQLLDDCLEMYGLTWAEQ